MLVALSLTPQPKVFASNSIGCEAELYQLSTLQLTDTPTLTATDIINDTDFVEQIANNQQESLPTTSPYKSSATKDVPQYWQMRVNNSDVSINANDVKYRLISSNETNNPFQENKVELRVLGSIEQIENCSDETTVIAGGISLQFNELSELTPGIFQSEIEVCIPVNGVQCD